MRPYEKIRFDVITLRNKTQQTKYVSNIETTYLSIHTLKSGCVSILPSYPPGVHNLAVRSGRDDPQLPPHHLPSPGPLAVASYPDSSHR